MGKMVMYIKNAIFQGPPADAESRIEKEKKCYHLLADNKIPFTGIDHDHADTIELCKEVEEKLQCKICKNLFLTNRQMTDFYLLLMPGDKIFKTKFLSKALGVSRLSFANADQMLELLNITPGSVSILGLMNDTGKKVRLLMDRDLLSDEYLGCHPCINTSTLKIRMDDVIHLLIPALGHEITFVELPWESIEE